MPGRPRNYVYGKQTYEDDEEAFEELENRVEDCHGHLEIQLELVYGVCCKTSLTERSGGMIIESFGTNESEGVSENMAARSLLLLIHDENSGLPWAALEQPGDILVAMMKLNDLSLTKYTFDEEGGSILLRDLRIRTLVLGLERTARNMRDLAASMLDMLNQFWKDAKGY